MEPEIVKFSVYNVTKKFDKDWTRLDFQHIAYVGMVVKKLSEMRRPGLKKDYVWDDYIFLGYEKCKYQGRNGRTRFSCETCKGKISVTQYGKPENPVSTCLTQSKVSMSGRPGAGLLGLRWNKYNMTLEDNLFEI
jgi:hypothetical protein